MLLASRSTGCLHVEGVFWYNSVFSFQDQDHLLVEQWLGMLSRVWRCPSHESSVYKVASTQNCSLVLTITTMPGVTLLKA